MSAIEQNIEIKPLQTITTNHATKLSYLSSELSKLDSKCSAFGLGSKNISAPPIK